MGGFSELDYVNFRYLVHSNVVVSMSQLLKGAEKFQLQIDADEKVQVWPEMCGPELGD